MLRQALSKELITALPLLELYSRPPFTVAMTTHKNSGCKTVLDLPHRIYDHYLPQVEQGE